VSAVGVTDVFNPQTRWVNLGAETIRVDSARKVAAGFRNASVIQTMPRSQKEESLDFINVKTGERKHILTETDPAWVNVTGRPSHFLPRGRYFLWASERDGFMHLYRFTMDGTLVNQITKWQLAWPPRAAFSGSARRFAGIDSENDWIYFTRAQRFLHRAQPLTCVKSRRLRPHASFPAESGPMPFRCLQRENSISTVFSNNRTLPSLAASCPR